MWLELGHDEKRGTRHYGNEHILGTLFLDFVKEPFDTSLTFQGNSKEQLSIEIDGPRLDRMAIAGSIKATSIRIIGQENIGESDNFLFQIILGFLRLFLFNIGH